MRWRDQSTGERIQYPVMRLIPFAVVATMAFGIAAMGCPASVCPYSQTSALTVDPPQACLETKLTSCVKPTLEIKSHCDDALYLPVDYGTFPADAAPGTEIEILKNDTITYEVNDEKATSRTAARKDYAIPARIGAEKITFRFFVSS